MSVTILQTDLVLTKREKEMEGEEKMEEMQIRKFYTFLINLAWFIWDH